MLLRKMDTAGGVRAAGRRTHTHAVLDLTRLCYSCPQHDRRVRCLVRSSTPRAARAGMCIQTEQLARIGENRGWWSDGGPSPGCEVSCIAALLPPVVRASASLGAPSEDRPPSSPGRRRHRRPGLPRRPARGAAAAATHSVASADVMDRSHASTGPVPVPVDILIYFIMHTGPVHVRSKACTPFPASLDALTLWASLDSPRRPVFLCDPARMIPGGTALSPLARRRNAFRHRPPHTRRAPTRSPRSKGRREWYLTLECPTR